MSAVDTPEVCQSARALGSSAADRRTWALEQLGRTLAGRYRLEELRGIGGMGAVYVGQHLHVGSRVAIKLILPGRAKTGDRDGLREEAQRAASVGGSGVVQVTDFDFDEGGDAFLVMELLDGETLAERIVRAGSIAPAEAIRILTEVLEVLARVHDKGVVHGDLKPSNLFLTVGEPSPVKILDFGIASAFGEPASGVEESSGVRGTPAFMAPEQLEGRTSPQADVYAAGAVLYQALSGRRPYDGLSGSDVLTELRAGPPHPLGALVPTLRPSLVRVVERAMAREPSARFESASALRDALLPLLEHDMPTAGEAEDATLTSPVSLEPEPKADAKPRRPTRDRLLAAFLMALLFAGLGVLGWVNFGPDASPEAEAPISNLVIVPFGERFAFPAVVVDRSEGTARVVFSDGDIGTVPESEIRPDTIVPGVCLVVRVTGGGALPGCVIRRHGDALLLQMREGPPRWTSLARLALPRGPTALGAYRPVEAASPGELGSRVLANFQGRGAYYPGTVVARDAHGRMLIVYSDGDSEWVEAAEVRFDEIEVGTEVRAAPRRTAVPDADIGDGIVLERNGFAMNLRFSDGREGWVSIANVQITAAQARP